MLCNRVLPHELNTFGRSRGAAVVAWLPVAAASGRAVLCSGCGLCRGRAQEPARVLAPLSTGTLPSTGVGGFRLPAGTVTWGWQGGVPALSLLLTQPPGQQQFVWVSTSGSSSSATPQKHEGRILLYSQSSLWAHSGWDEHTGVQCRVLHNCSGCSAETSKASLHLVYSVSVSLTASLWLTINPVL